MPFPCWASLFPHDPFSTMPLSLYISCCSMRAPTHCTVDTIATNFVLNYDPYMKPYLWWWISIKPLSHAGLLGCPRQCVTNHHHNHTKHTSISGFILCILLHVYIPQIEDAWIIPYTATLLLCVIDKMVIEKLKINK